MAKQFSFDIVSDYDAAELDHALDQARREIANRYDFKGTQAAVDYMDDKSGIKITGDNDFHLDSIVEMLRQKLAKRGVSQKVLNSEKEPVTSGMVKIWELPFQKGLDQEKAKKITKLIRDHLPKVKTQIQGEEIRVTSAKKDELQSVMTLIKETEFEFPVEFQNYR